MNMTKSLLMGLAALCLAGPNLCQAAPLSYLEDRDIGALMQEAESEFPLDEQDAVILFEGMDVVFTDDGRAETTHHRIVWIGTEMGIRRYADLRIPFDSQRTTFDTLALRTWRDDRWWVSGDTAKVETLPFAVAQASDYTQLRDMMLLHDGIELPCILETAYTIADKEPFRGGIHGIWIFPKHDPIVRSALTLHTSADNDIAVTRSDDVPQPTKGRDEESGLSFHHWEMGPIDHIGQPETADPAGYCPHVAYSTYGDWSSLGGDLASILQGALKEDQAIGDIGEFEQCETPELACAEEIATFVNQKTRLITTDVGFWMTAPRQPSRIYDTAYGHALDRAVLAAALLQHAGFPVAFVFRGRTWGRLDDSVATLDRFEGPGVVFGEKGGEAVFDPVSGHISRDLSWGRGRTVWIPGQGDPSIMWPNSNGNNAMKIDLELAFDAEKAHLVGTGTLACSGTLSLFGQMVGAQDETLKTLSRVLAGVLPSAEVSSYNPSAFGPDSVVLNFGLTAKLPDQDDLNRIALTIGQPGSGLVAHLGPDTALSLDERASPVTLPSAMSQEIRVSIDLQGLDPTWVPQETRLENEAGKFALTVADSDEELIISRSVSIDKQRFAADEWPDLRRLVLAELHEQNATILFNP